MIPNKMAQVIECRRRIDYGMNVCEVYVTLI